MNKTKTLTVICCCLATAVVVGGAWIWIGSANDRAKRLEAAQTDYTRTSARLEELKKEWDEIQQVKDFNRYLRLVDKHQKEHDAVLDKWQRAMTIISQQGGAIPDDAKNPDDH